MGYFFIEKQKVVLFPKYWENGWESAASALITSHFLNFFLFSFLCLTHYFLLIWLIKCLREVKVDMLKINK
jgi:hypothetical protein